jgi:hypothetical protein
LTPPEQVLNLDSGGLSMYETAAEAAILLTHGFDVIDIPIHFDAKIMEIPALNIAEWESHKIGPVVVRF